MSETIRLKSAEGQSVEGELVVESFTHYQVAINGKVMAFEKSKWSKATGFDDLLGGMNPFNDFFKK